MAGGLTGVQGAAYAGSSAAEGLPLFVLTGHTGVDVSAGATVVMFTVKTRCRVLDAFAHITKTSGGAATVKLTRTRAGAAVDLTGTFAAQTIDTLSRIGSIILDDTYCVLEAGDIISAVAATNTVSAQITLLCVRTEE